ncbi:MAG: hypothetical protein AAFP93_00285 [Bacteroidota bacterium]
MRIRRRNQKEAIEITEEQLRELVIEPFFSQGEECFEERMVELLEKDTSKIHGRAIDNTVYFPTLYFDDGELSGICSCHPFQVYGPCKHMAATGLAWIAKSQHGTYKPSPAYEARMLFFDTVYYILGQKSKKDLVSLLMDVIIDDPKKAFLLREDGALLLADNDFWV